MFVHGDDFISTGDSMQLAWIETLNEGLILKRRAILGPDDGQMNLDGANAKSVTTPAVKIQEWTPQMLT